MAEKITITGTTNPYQDDRSLLRSELGTNQAFMARLAAKLPGFNPDALLTRKGYEIAEEMMRNSIFGSAVNIKRSAVLYKYNGPDGILPIIRDEKNPGYAEAQEMAAYIRYLVDNIETTEGFQQTFHDALWQVLFGIVTGFSVSELIWRVYDAGPYKGKFGLSNIAFKGCDMIGFELDDQTLVPKSVNSYTDNEGYKWRIPVRKVLLYTYRPHGNTPYGFGEVQPCYKHYWSINAIYAFWNVFVEVFGGPFIVAQAPAGKMLAEVERTIKKIRQGSPAVLPQNVAYTIENSGQSGKTAFEAAVDHHKTQILLAVLFQSMTTTQSGMGSNAMATVQQDTQEFSLGYVRTTLAACARSLFKRAILYSFGPDMVPYAPELNLGVWDSTDRLKLAQAFGVLLANNVVHWSEPWLREQFQAPAASEEVRVMLETAEQEKRKNEAAKAAKAQNPVGGPQNGE